VTFTGITLLAISAAANCALVGSCIEVNDVSGKGTWINPNKVIESSHLTAVRVDSNITFDPLATSSSIYVPQKANLGVSQKIQLSVPFTSQAPHKNWSSTYDEACEEAS